MSEQTQIATTTHKLTRKQELFVQHYVNCLNAKRAAELAGYNGDDNTLAVTAHDLLINPNVRVALDALFQSRRMSSQEILSRLESHAEGDLGEFLNDDGIPDLSKARGKTHLLKKLRTRVTHGTGEDGKDWESIDQEIELHDPQRALELLGRAQRLFVDKIEIDDTTLDDSARVDRLVNLLASAARKASGDVIEGEAKDVS